MKKLVSLFLALALCLSLTVPALASIHEVYIYDADGETVDSDKVKGLSFTEEGAVLNGASGIDLTLGSSPTIILAPGSKNTLLRLIGGDSDYTNDMTIKGTGELILYNPNPYSFGEGYGAFFGLITSLKLEDGLVMTGGAKEDDSYPLSIQVVEKSPVNGFLTYSACTADKTPARYVRIAPKAAEKPADKPAAPSSTGFTDVPDSHYAAAAIQDCAAKGIVSGYSDGTFKPGKTVTKNNFSVMLSRAFYPEDVAKYQEDSGQLLYPVPFGANKLALSNHQIFYYTSFDGIEDSWYEDIMDTEINRYDMAQLLANILKDKGFAVSDSEKAAARSQVADYDRIPQNQGGDFYKDAVATVYSLGLIGGYSDGCFHGERTMNRGQACVVIDRMARYMDSNTPAETPKTPEKTPETPAETPAPSGTDLEAMRQGVLELVNAERSKAGKSPLTLSDSLCDVAQLRADEIVKSFSHTRPNGSSCFTALNGTGLSYRTCGENIAAGQGTPTSVMDSWMNSEGHRANILSGDFSSIGIGYVKASSGYGHYWVQMFLG